MTLSPSEDITATPTHCSMAPPAVAFAIVVTRLSHYEKLISNRTDRDGEKKNVERHIS